MLFFKKTISFQLVTLLEKFEVEGKYINIFLYIIKLFKLYLSIRIKIYRNTSINKKIELLHDLFKERFYLEDLRSKYNIDSSSLDYDIINNNIISEITYNNVKLYIEYGLYDDKYSIYVLNKENKGINITEDSLKFKMNYDILISILGLMQNEICLILGTILTNTVKRVRRVKKNV